MPDVPGLTELRLSIAETIAWCRLRASVDDPRHSLRTPELRPSNLDTTPNEWGNFDYVWGTAEENQRIVSGLARRRAELLRKENAYTDALPADLAGGRLLIASPYQSITMCMAEEETDGFIDELDVPAWDTWISYFLEPTNPEPDEVRREQESYRNAYDRKSREGFVEWQPPASVSYILCWIPEPFIEIVEMGMQVDVTYCFFWAAGYKQRHYNTPLLRELDAAGMLA